MTFHCGLLCRMGAAATFFAALLAPALRAQTTQLDLSKQSRNIDFSAASATKPVKTGAFLPAVCSTGEYFFLTTATAGTNTYACVATNTWSQQGGGVSSVFGRSGAISKSEGDYTLADLGDVSGAKGNSGVVQLFGGGATTASDCAMFDASGNIVSAGAPCGSGSGGGSVSVSAGFGVLTSSSAGTTVISIDTATIPTFLATSALIDFPAIAPASCNEQSFPMTGAAAGDTLAPGWPPAIESGLAPSARVSAANTVTLRLCNFTAASIDPLAATFRVTLLRSF